MSELYELLKNNLDHTGLPVMEQNLFKHTTEKYGKEEFRKTLAEFITNEKPPYPLKEFDMEKVVDVFVSYKRQTLQNISVHQIMSWKNMMTTNMRIKIMV